METLINELQKRAQEGARTMDVQSVSLGVVVDHCWRTVETAEGTCTVDAEATVRADRHLLQQLLKNLFRNAVEHGGPDVTVRVGDLDSGFYVADDGPGIPAAERADIFERGYSKKRDGMGYGLAIVERAVQAHDWDISVTESASGGVRFEIRGVTVEKTD